MAYTIIVPNDSGSLWIDSPTSIPQVVFNQLRGISSTVVSSTPKERAEPRHEKMTKDTRPWWEERKPHWEMVKRLGLVGEMDKIEKLILKRDILEMTQGAGYPEVTDADLEALFEFPRLRRMVRKHNFLAALPFIGRGREEVTLRLKKDSITSAGVEIPYGAMLRYEEAKAAGFFTDFKVVYPNVVTESELARERRKAMDPAIVGYFQDSMFLIVSWDLPKDVAKTEARLEDLLALKLKD